MRKAVERILRVNILINLGRFIVGENTSSGGILKSCCYSYSTMPDTLYSKLQMKDATFGDALGVAYRF